MAQYLRGMPNSDPLRLELFYFLVFPARLATGLKKLVADLATVSFLNAMAYLPAFSYRILGLSWFLGIPDNMDRKGMAFQLFT